MRRLVAQRRHRMRRFGWPAVVFFVVMLWGLPVAFAALGRWTVAAFMLIFGLAFGGYLLWANTRIRRHCRRMDEALGSAPPTADPAVS
ncbi:MAG: hypothetical protein ACRDP3_13720 [Streptomyces sp.]|uniref:hypothetical protein n=1 Tax=Streptomyces sp. TaxID=1931 RepID=UPI003D6A9CAE